jgi:FtsP/CotA-like multicopper oxidase with cupredoxin domain
VKRLWVASVLGFALVGCTLNGGMGIPGAGPRSADARFAEPPDVLSSHHVATFDLSSDTAGGLPQFVYKGQAGVEPTIRVNPGDTIVVNLQNGLSGQQGMADDLNLHFHGLGVSPRKPSDDVLTMLAMPGQTLHYVVRVPASQPPGLYWYHPHVHGETEYQVGLGGMSGAIVIGGIEKHYPALAKMPEQLMILRTTGGNAGEEVARHRRRLAGLEPNSSCGGFYSGFVTVNGALDPTISFAPGKPIFFRILNATGHRTMDLVLRGLSMQIVGVDGYPLDTQPHGPKTMTVTHFVVAPAGRVEFVATPTKVTTLSTLCYDSGPVGDQDPAQELVKFKPGANAGPASAVSTGLPGAFARVTPEALPPPAAHRVVVFTEDANGFYINGKAFEPSAKPTFVVHTGTVEEWTVNNLTSEMHDFHLHQVHFLVKSVDGVPVKNPVWSDTFVVPWQTSKSKPGTIDLLADFRSPLIKGTFLFHCHILDHEDQGMMAKIQAI